MTSVQVENTFSTKTENENQRNSFIHHSRRSFPSPGEHLCSHWFEESLSECVKAAQRKVWLDGQVVAKAILFLSSPF